MFGRTQRDLKCRHSIPNKAPGLLVLRIFRKKELAVQVRGRTAARLDEDDVGLMPGGERFTSHQVGADVFADGRVGAASRLNSENPGG